MTMTSAPLIDADALLAPIPGDNPTGCPVPFGVREELERLRKEIDPADFAPDDLMRPAAFQKADWAGIVRRAQETLTGTSKDLLVAARLTEALVKEHGFAGLRDGLHLLRELVEQCWDRLNPAVESDEDLEIRAAPFFWLDEPDRGALFPNTLRMVPMLHGEKGPYSWVDWKEAQGGKGQITPADVDKAIEATPREDCQALVDDLSQSSQELDALSQDLNAKLGQYAPAFTGLRQALGECRTLAEQILQRKGPGESQVVSGGGTGAEGDQTTNGRPSSGDGQAISRAQVYRQLSEAAALLQRLEPQSPIPYLINRAVELGSLPFPELMKQLIRNNEVLGEMNRELGIKEPPRE